MLPSWYLADGQMRQATSAIAKVDERARNSSARIALALPGIYGFYVGFWIWRVALGVPLEVKGPANGITMDDSTYGFVRPWAPWWIVPVIAAVLAVLLWQRAGAMKARPSFLRMFAALLTSAAVAYPASQAVLLVGEMSQMDPFPGAARTLSILPQLVLLLVKNTALQITFDGPAIVFFALVATAVYYVIIRIAMFSTRKLS
jgi:hypothetical protein